jgi:zinc D-Ala-D-Ala carboxypeptidase
MTNGKYVSGHIMLSEYRCPCCGAIPYDTESLAHRELFQAYEDIRSTLKRPLRITSGFRCPKHNADIGGEPLSIHLFGLALDIDAVDIGEVETLVTAVNLVAPNLRMGVGIKTGTFIHVDTGYRIIPRVMQAWHEGARWNG